MTSATVDKIGNVKWYNNKGKLHRKDGPALVLVAGHKYWCVNGKLHRKDGPAIEYADGSYEWWANGKRIAKTPM